MEQRVFGGTGKQVPVLGQGTWQMEEDDREEAIRSLRAGLDLGLTHVDTAELYGHGRVEESIVSEAIAGRREEVFLVSKVMPSNATYAGTLTACERSLKRLRTDWLDCYLLHWPGSHPLAETVRAFEKLVADGKIRSWGVSNFAVSDLDELLTLTKPERIACNQVLYHLEERAIEHAVLPWCEERGVAVVGYSPFGNGRFPKPQSPGGRVLEAIARAHDATARQVALQFLVRRPSLFAIPKASRVAHLRDNAAAVSLKLSADELARIDAAFPKGAYSDALPVI
ncbi:aldo/keto reductase [Myxococcus llanfairpwllgwyngyllgogerychwyrndrobwllllantysiliogogogochensis]|uniref:Aldo/keto reductase n=1 Tax=Myxococcus llanfairpwllgwyngyllgogerychwyrndrobwllllantysiliogogogochensis TaxID=2590453 RepID=A0A540X1Q0_9BACT|nr:aldo/keto reductase [Myxococcus llanfairpwllgwyngyllgogerychwyrndrobwllllantysiliogogogochensis]TQF15189.1 aldo/keto reductase [Myxococcus llanfairpwllgwyngyllgogerychwyrndrobwllllantysiliogogogochensis]